MVTKKPSFSTLLTIGLVHRGSLDFFSFGGHLHLGSELPAALCVWSEPCIKRDASFEAVDDMGESLAGRAEACRVVEVLRFCDGEIPKVAVAWLSRFSHMFL